MGLSVKLYGIISETEGGLWPFVVIYYIYKFVYYYGIIYKAGDTFRDYAVCDTREVLFWFSSCVSLGSAPFLPIYFTNCTQSTNFPLISWYIYTFCVAICAFAFMSMLRRLYTVWLQSTLIHLCFTSLDNLVFVCQCVCTSQRMWERKTAGETER